MARNKNSSKKISKEPFRSATKIAEIKLLLKNNQRELLLFIIGINTGLRVCDLVRIKAGQIKNKNVGEELEVVEKKTGKRCNIIVSSEMRRTLDSYFERYKSQLDDDDYLFWSQKGGHLNLQRVRHMIQKWAKSVGLDPKNYGAHSLRKTFGYIQRMTFGRSAWSISKSLNHSSPSSTMVYIGIEDKEITDILMNEI